MPWAPEVIADSSGKWCGNGLRFATKQEALDNVYDLASRWFMVRETRVVEMSDAVTATYFNHELVFLKDAPIVKDLKPCATAPPATS